MWPNKIVICRTNKDICKICGCFTCSKGTSKVGTCVICFDESGYSGNEKIYHWSQSGYTPENDMTKRIIKTEEEVLKLIIRTKNEKDRAILKYIFKNFDRVELLKEK